MSGEHISREAFSEVLETAIKMQELAMKMLDAEDDPELQMSLKVYNDILNGIKEFPAADVVAVVHGRWEQVEVIHIEDLKEEDKDCISIASMFCPKCKRYHSEVYMYGSPTESVRYCPACGAKMDGGQDDV